MIADNHGQRPARRHILQPRTSRSCGQAVIAMILGLSLKEARALIGHNHGTKASELHKVLNKHGVMTGGIQLTRHESIPPYAILRSSKPGRRNWHWMLIWNGHIFDPAGNWPNPGWEITSFIPFTIEGLVKPVAGTSVPPPVLSKSILYEREN